MLRKSILLSLLVAMALLSGCSTHRINQFENFAKAGKGYTEAIVVLSEEAGNAAIDTDSHLLIKDRDSFDETERTSEYSKRTKALKELLSELRKFRKHSDLLKKYFLSLETLATSDAPSGISESAGNLVEELQKVSPALKEATIGEATVKDCATKAVSISVAIFQQKALEKELKANAKTIERELDLQHAFLSALSIELEADLNDLIKIKEYQEVAKPYKEGAKLPEDWVKNRRELLSSVVMMSSVDNAKKAAKELKKTFVALAENKIQPGDFENLFADINSILDLIELVQKTTGE